MRRRLTAMWFSFPLRTIPRRRSWRCARRTRRCRCLNGLQRELPWKSAPASFNLPPTRSPIARNYSSPSGPGEARGAARVWPRPNDFLGFVPGREPVIEISMSGRGILRGTAIKLAIRQMIDFPHIENGMSRENACILCSVAGDVDFTQLVDGPMGVHVMMPKAIFKAK